MLSLTIGQRHPQPVGTRFIDSNGVAFPGLIPIGISKLAATPQNEQIARAIRSGIDRNGQPYKPPMAFSFYATITDSDMAALVAYLRSLPAVTAGGAVK